MIKDREKLTEATMFALQRHIKKRLNEEKINLEKSTNFYEKYASENSIVQLINLFIDLVFEIADDESIMKLNSWCEQLIDYSKVL